MKVSAFGLVAGTALIPVGGYQSAVITTAATATAETIPDVPPPDVEFHVLTTVLAQTSQFNSVTMTYPLTVTNSGGTWMVAAIDAMPQPDSGEDARQVGAPN